MSVRAGVIGAIVGSVVTAVLTVPASYYIGRELAEDQDQLARPGRVGIDPVLAPRAFVGRTVEVQGTAEVPSDADLLLWVVVRVDVNSATTYYPQGAASVDETGRWSCVVNLGSRVASDDGPYLVIAQLVDGATARTYRRYVRAELPTDGNGMDEYNPDDVVRMEAVALQRDISLDSGVIDGDPYSCE